MARKAYYIKVGENDAGKNLMYKFFAGTTAYQGLTTALGVTDSFDSATDKAVDEGTFSDYPEITQVRLCFRSGGSIVRLAQVNSLPLLLVSGANLQGGPNNLLIDRIKFVRQRRRK